MNIEKGKYAAIAIIAKRSSLKMVIFYYAAFSSLYQEQEKPKITILTSIIKITTGQQNYNVHGARAYLLMAISIVGYFSMWITTSYIFFMFNAFYKGLEQLAQGPKQITPDMDMHRPWLGPQLMGPVLQSKDSG